MKKKFFVRKKEFGSIKLSQFGTAMLYQTSEVHNLSNEVSLQTKHKN